MTQTAKKTDPKLWTKVKEKVTKSGKGGKPGQWSARKAQLATSEYQEKGGGYQDGKSNDNSLSRWTDEEWDTKSGEPSGRSGERYLPKKAREKLSDAEYHRTTDKKRADTAEGKQHSKQPAKIARKTAGARGKGRASGATATKADLMKEARRLDIAGRSKMSKAELQKAVGNAK